jgi:Tfp pilus assembly protein PilF
MGRTSVSFMIVILLSGSACAVRAVPGSSATAPADRSFDAYLKQGTVGLARGDYGRAQEALRMALSIRPDSSKAHNYLGLCYFHQKDYDPANEQFEKAVALDPSFAAAYNNLAGIYSIKQQFARAEDAYRKALALAPDLVSSNYSLGILLSGLGRTDEGVLYLSRGIALNPEYLEEHKETLTTIMSLSFDTKESYCAYAKAYASAGYIDKTVEYLGKAREAGFADWPHLLSGKEFEKIRDDPRIRDFLK